MLSDSDLTIKRIPLLAGEITGLHPRVEALTAEFGENIEQIERAENGEELYQSEYWKIGRAHV